MFPFQSTRPVRGGTLMLILILLSQFYFNPPAPCGAGRPKIPIAPPRSNFNPPAPCGAGLVFDCSCSCFCYFNPPAPCGAGRSPAQHLRCRTPEFQSTRPVRGGTLCPHFKAMYEAISIHPPRAGRDLTVLNSILGQCISIHPPRAGRDLLQILRLGPLIYFNPPAPCGAGR